MNLTEKIRTNLLAVNEKIDSAAASSGRKASDVQLVVVSKGQPIEVIQAAVEAGVRDFGENYPEESVPKIQSFPAESLTWHMIGHLQSRKTHLVCEYFQWMHSLDSFRLAEKLERHLAVMNQTLPVLLEINVGGEESKSGWLAPDESYWPSLRDEIGQILQLPHLDVRGLMTMPPLTTAPVEARNYFKKLVKLQEYLRSQFPDASWKELSMGTSSDFETAVEEGATFIRIGTAILGPRLGRKISKFT